MPVYHDLPSSEDERRRRQEIEDRMRRGDITPDNRLRVVAMARRLLPASRDGIPWRPPSGKLWGTSSDKVPQQLEGYTPDDILQAHKELPPGHPLVVNEAVNYLMRQPTDVLREMIQSGKRGYGLEQLWQGFTQIACDGSHDPYLLADTASCRAAFVEFIIGVNLLRTFVYDNGETITQLPTRWFPIVSRFWPKYKSAWGEDERATVIEATSELRIKLRADFSTPHKFDDTGPHRPRNAPKNDRTRFCTWFYFYEYCRNGDHCEHPHRPVDWEIRDHCDKVWEGDSINHQGAGASFGVVDCFFHLRTQGEPVWQRPRQNQAFTPDHVATAPKTIFPDWDPVYVKPLRPSAPRHYHSDQEAWSHARDDPWKSWEAKRSSPSGRQWWSEGEWSHGQADWQHMWPKHHWHNHPWYSGSSSAATHRPMEKSQEQLDAEHLREMRTHMRNFGFEKVASCEDREDAFLPTWEHEEWLRRFTAAGEEGKEREI